MRFGNYDIGLFYARKVVDTPQSQPTDQQRGLAVSNPALAEYLGLTSPSYTAGVSERQVLGLPPAWSAIRYISESIASLDRGVFTRDADGDVTPDYDSPVARLFNGRPHPHYTTSDFLQALMTSACFGNGYARIWRDDVTNDPVRLELVPREMVRITYSTDGTLFYFVSGFLSGRHVSWMVPETDMIHIKGVTMTGIDGQRVNLIHKNSFSAGVGAQQYTDSWFNSGASVGGILSYQGVLKKEQRDKIVAKLKQRHLGALNAGSMMLLDGGAEFKPVTAGPKDSKVIDFSNLNTVETSQIFKVPLHLLSHLDNSSFSNMEQQNQDYIIHCLHPWTVKVAEEFTTKLMTTLQVRRRRKFFSLDLKKMQMGDMEAQAKFFSSMVQNAIWTPNEVRLAQGKNKHPDGDNLFIQQSMAPVNELVDILKAKTNGSEQPEQSTSATGDESDDGERAANAGAVSVKNNRPGKANG